MDTTTKKILLRLFRLRSTCVCGQDRMKTILLRSACLQPEDSGSQKINLVSFLLFIYRTNLLDKIIGMS
jgi:hypothetical protein